MILPGLRVRVVDTYKAMRLFDYLDHEVLLIMRLIHQLLDWKWADRHIVIVIFIFIFIFRLHFSRKLAFLVLCRSDVIPRSASAGLAGRRDQSWPEPFSHFPLSLSLHISLFHYSVRITLRSRSVSFLSFFSSFLSLFVLYWLMGTWIGDMVGGLMTAFMLW